MNTQDIRTDLEPVVDLRGKATIREKNRRLIAAMFRAWDKEYERINGLTT